jgi:hypothetical protein
METYLEQIIAVSDLPSLSIDVLQQIIFILEQQTDDLLSSFVTQSYDLLVKLEHKIWQILSLNSREWFNQSIEFFQTLASFNKKIVFNQEHIKDDMKVSLLFPETIDQVNNIFHQIEQSNDDNDRLITIAGLWFDNLAFFLHEYPQLSHLPLSIHIHDYFGHHFLLSDQFKSYLIELHQLPSIFTAKQLFYLKTCPVFLNALFHSDPPNCNYTPEEVIKHIGEDYLQMIQVHSCTIELWGKELLSCITHLTGFMRAFLWWNGDNGANLKLLFSTEKILCEYIQAVIRIIDYQPFYQSIMTQWSNDETILMDSILLILINIVQTQNISWFFRSMTQLPGIVFKLGELSIYSRIHLCAYGILSETLTHENLKSLQFTAPRKFLFFKMLEQAWHDPSKTYKQIPIIYLLRGKFTDFIVNKLQRIFLKVSCLYQRMISFNK